MMLSILEKSEPVKITCLKWQNIQKRIKYVAECRVLSSFAISQANYAFAGCQHETAPANVGGLLEVLPNQSQMNNLEDITQNPKQLKHQTRVAREIGNTLNISIISPTFQGRCI